MFKPTKLLMFACVFFLGLPMGWSQHPLDQKVNSIGGKEMSLDQYKGKPVLFVNIATRCGYTPQLKPLEALYQKYKDKGLMVVGIPSNDFGGQTPEGNKDVKKFCLLNYGVSFPLTEKTAVSGQDKHPLIKSLLQQAKNKDDIQWNFEKFLVGKDGKLVARYSSSTDPMGAELQKAVEATL